MIFVLSVRRKLCSRSYFLNCCCQELMAEGSDGLARIYIMSFGVMKNFRQAIISPKLCRLTHAGSQSAFYRCDCTVKLSWKGAGVPSRQIINIAATMVYDLGLNQRFNIVKARRGLLGPAKDLAPNRGISMAPVNSNDLESRRALLGCYYLCAR